MKVLLLTQVLPYPPDSGPKVKTYNVIKYLSRRHEITLVSFIRAGESRHVGELARFCARVHTVEMRRSSVRDARFLAASLLSHTPFLVCRDWSPEMGNLVRRLTREEQFDVVHVDQLGMAQYARLAKGVHTVLDQHNAVYTVVRRLARAEGWRLRRPFLELEWRKLRHYEGRVCAEFDHVLTVTDEDRQHLLEASHGRGSFSTVPIAVDVEETLPVQRRPDAKSVVSIATMYYPPNVDGVLWFATEVFPLIRRLAPATRFTVVGARPPMAVRRLTTRDPNIVVTGYVENLAPVLSDAALLIVPLRSGSGMRVKILEAFARGIPVVSTSIGCEGIDVTPGEDILVADAPLSFSQAVLRLLQDTPFAERLAAKARCLVEKKYDWRTACAGIEAAYEARKDTNPLDSHAVTRHKANTEGRFRMRS